MWQKMLLLGGQARADVTCIVLVRNAVYLVCSPEVKGV